MHIGVPVHTQGSLVYRARPLIAWLRRLHALFEKLRRIYLLCQETSKGIPSIGTPEPGLHQLFAVEIGEDVGLLERHFN